MNDELAESMVAPVWLHHNDVLSGLLRSVEHQTSTVRKEIDDVNLMRQRAQQGYSSDVAHGLLANKTTSLQRRDEAVYKAWLIKGQCDVLSTDSKRMKLQ